MAYLHRNTGSVPTVVETEELYSGVTLCGQIQLTIESKESAEFCFDVRMSVWEAKKLAADILQVIKEFSEQE